ncbi:MAG TPA: hypothetical protein VK473_09100 [Terriglobales bacterium]|nr:hypothetical protein [Terriglobales bacterium]
MSETSGKPETMMTFGKSHLSPGAYTLDLSQVENSPVLLNGKPSTFYEALGRLEEAKIEEMPRDGLWSLEYITDGGKIIVAVTEEEGQWSLLSVLRKLVELAQEGIAVRYVRWLYYDYDVSDDADVMHVFFLADGSRIVSEYVGFLHCDPLILKKVQGDRTISHSRPFFDAAWEAYWYRKFYTETLQGQLMVLRPDEPLLYSYQRPPARDLVRDVQLVTLVKMYRLLWVAIPLLAAIAFPIISIYMAIVAALLMVDILWRSWATRNIGENL